MGLTPSTTLTGEVLARGQPSANILNVVRRRDIQRVAGQIAEKFDPDRVILFGSYAYGRPTEDSDVDLLVVMSFRGPSCRQARRIEAAVRAPFRADIIVRRQRDIERRIPQSDWFLEEIVNRGDVLYESGRRLARCVSVPAGANECVDEWQQKGDEWLGSARALFRSRKSTFLTGIAHHASVAVEFYLKAILTCYGIRFPKCQDLSELLDLALAADPQLIEEREMCIQVMASGQKQFEVTERATRDEAVRAVELAKRMRSRMREFAGESAPLRSRL